MSYTNDSMTDPKQTNNDINKSDRKQRTGLDEFSELNLTQDKMATRWFVDYPDESGGKGSGDNNNNKIEENDKGGEVTFERLMTQMNRFERELSEVQFTNEDMVTNGESEEENEDYSMGEREDYLNQLRNYLENGRRRSLSESGNDKKQKDYKGKQKKLSKNDKSLSRSLGDLLSFTNAFATDIPISDDEDKKTKSKTDDDLTNSPRTTGGRKSISVDVNCTDSKSHIRRRGLNPVQEENDAVTALGQFQENRKKEKKKKKSGGSLTASLENLGPTASFIAKRFSKGSKKMDALNEEDTSSRDIKNISLMSNSVRKISRVVNFHVNTKGEPIRTVEIHKTQNQSLGFFIKFGNGIDRDDGIFVSRVTLGSLIDVNNLLHTGDEILKINKVDVTGQTLEDVVATMQKTEILFIEARSALPFDTHVSLPLYTPNDVSPKTVKKTRPISVLPKTSLYPLEPGTKKRANTDTGETHHVWTTAYDNTMRKLKESEMMDSCDSTDSEDMNENNNNNNKEDRLEAYESDDVTHFTSLLGFTGKLAVGISTIGGISTTDFGSSMCYCTIEIDKEFEAKTKSQKLTSSVHFDEDFDIAVQGASIMVIKLYLEHRLLSDKCLATSVVFLENVFSDGNHKRIVLSSIKESINTQLNLRFTEARRHLERRQSSRASGVFGFNLSQTLVTEKNTIPTLVRKCVAEVEKRGLELEGIYRISGNARKKKELREQFEKDSRKVNLDREGLDCHVITGVLKDYLRKLPNPLITDEMYKILAEQQHKETTDEKLQRTTISQMLKKAPYVNRATLIFLLDHFQRVIGHFENNKMSAKNLAVCFGPTMLSPPIEEMRDFQKYIDALEFLISIWPLQANDDVNL